MWKKFAPGPLSCYVLGLTDHLVGGGVESVTLHGSTEAGSLERRHLLTRGRYRKPFKPKVKHSRNYTQ